MAEEIEAISPLTADEKNSRFSFQGQKLFLTYDTHLDKIGTATVLEQFLGFKPKFCRMAHEVGMRTGTPYRHTHILLDFGKRWQCKSSRRLDIEVSGEGIYHPHWRPIKTKTHWYNAVRYLAKEDPANADLKTSSFVSKVWSASSLQDALVENVSNPNDVAGILALFREKPKIAPKCPKPDRPWQLEVLALLETPPSPRSVHWFFDPVGNTGKTHLAKYLLVNDLAAIIADVGSKRDFATTMRGIVESGWDEKCIIFDLPRDCEHGAIYFALECAKNGIITSVKYAGKTIAFSNPHTIVFANFMPEKSRMSFDRWKVHRILQNGTLEKSLDFGATSESKDSLLSCPSPREVPAPPSATPDPRAPASIGNRSDSEPAPGASIGQPKGQPGQPEGQPDAGGSLNITICEPPAGNPNEEDGELVELSIADFL